MSLDIMIFPKECQLVVVGGGGNPLSDYLRMCLFLSYLTKSKLFCSSNSKSIFLFPCERK